MAYITFSKKKLRKNFNYLNNLFKKKEIQWAIVSKLLCGHKDILRELLSLNISQICDSRISNLRIIKEIKPEIETIYIKPPAKRILKSLVQYADISVNTELQTIKLLSEEAILLKK